MLLRLKLRVMIAYLHLVAAHFGFWMALCMMMRLWKEGLPHWKELRKVLLSALIISAIMGVVTAHSHFHFLALLAKI